MVKTLSRFRLASSAFDRSDELNKINPKKMIFLSVEGDETERTYFEHLNSYLDNAVIKIEVLRHRHGDGYSDPKYVIELLSECTNVRDGEIIPDELPRDFYQKYSKKFIKDYIDYIKNENVLGENKVDYINFKNDLLKIGIDIEYRKYLQSFDKELDYFAVILDRDSESHSRDILEESIRKCKENNYGFFITNPCFDFWLLLHLCDVKSKYSAEELKEIHKNEKVSNRHTRVSAELSKLAKHKKHITSKKFENLYLPNIRNAIKNVQKFATKQNEILDNLGSNIPDLIDIIELNI